MSLATTDIADSLGLSETELMQQALINLLQEKRREIMQIRLGILGRYQVDTVADLENLITEGQAVEHPGWEDLITAENLDARLEEINVYLRDL
jgi:hypothetical protein